MNTQIFLQRASHSVTTTLTLASQRLPFIQQIAPLISSPVSLRLAAPIMTSFAGTHALTGQTTYVRTVEGSENPLNVTTGEEFTWQFFTARHSSGSFQVTGIPQNGNTEYSYTFTQEFNGAPRIFPGGTLEGAITAPGTYLVNITGFRWDDLSGNRTPPYTLTINVTEPVQPPTPQELYEEWRLTQWPENEAENDLISGPNADPDGDGIPNLLEYTLELDPNEAVRIGQLPSQQFGTDPDDSGMLLWELPYLGNGTLVFEESNDLASNDWTEVPAARIELLPNSIQMRASKEGGTKYFRLRATF